MRPLRPPARPRVNVNPRRWKLFTPQPFFAMSRWTMSNDASHGPREGLVVELWNTRPRSRDGCPFRLDGTDNGCPLCPNNQQIHTRRYFVQLDRSPLRNFQGWWDFRRISETLRNFVQYFVARIIIFSNVFDMLVFCCNCTFVRFVLYL